MGHGKPQTEQKEIVRKTISSPKQVFEKMDRIAENMGMSRSGFIRFLLYFFIQRREETNNSRGGST